MDELWQMDTFWWGAITGAIIGIVYYFYHKKHPSVNIPVLTWWSNLNPFTKKPGGLDPHVTSTTTRSNKMGRTVITGDSIKFRNPSNNYEEEVSRNTWLWCLLFGCFFFVYKGVWIHAIIGLACAIATSGISWLIYPFFAKKIMINNYRQKGWIEVLPIEVTVVPEELLRGK